MTHHEWTWTCSYNWKSSIVLEQLQIVQEKDIDEMTRPELISAIFKCLDVDQVGNETARGRWAVNKVPYLDKVIK